jgi:hypothetical protein
LSIPELALSLEVRLECPKRIGGECCQARQTRSWSATSPCDQLSSQLVEQLEELPRSSLDSGEDRFISRRHTIESSTDTEAATSFNDVTQYERTCSETRTQLPRLIWFCRPVADLTGQSEYRRWVHSTDFPGTVQVRAEEVHQALTQIRVLRTSTVGKRQYGNGG